MANDVVACRNYLAQHPNNYTKIGVLGSSAGGWVITKAEEKTDFDFMISVVVPATSVLDQQLQSMEAGWYELLEDTDIPDGVEGINDLWVRRHYYDPKNTLASFEQPLLAIYGEIDWIVPYKENVEMLNNYFSGERNALLNVVVVHDAEHGTETAAKYVTLRGNKSYWRFFRIAPTVQVEIVNFLKKYELIE